MDTLHSLTSYEQAINSLGVETVWSSSFGYPGEGGYTEYRRDAAGTVYTVGNGSWFDFAPFHWTATRLVPSGVLNPKRADSI